MGGPLRDGDWTTCANIEDAFVRTAMLELGASLQRERSPVEELFGEAAVTALQLRLLQRFSTFRLNGRSTREPLDPLLDQTIRIASLAAMAGLPRARLIRAFVERTGMTPHRYVMARRIAAAQRLLAATGLPVGHVAERVGCANSSHLNRLFRAHLGISPRVFRHRNGRLYKSGG